MCVDSPADALVVGRPDPELVRRARSVFGVLRDNADQGDADRQITRVASSALREAGLLNLVVPERLGGAGASARTLVECLVEIGRADGSAAWSAALVNACTWFCSTYGEQAQRDVWDGNSGATACGVFSPGLARQHQLGTGDEVVDGYLLSGEYPYASGSALADWATLGMLIDGPEGDPVIALGLVPSSDWTTKDTWFTLGMRGTGSNTIIVNEAFVPAHRVQTFDNLACGVYETPHAAAESGSRAALLPMSTVVLAAPMVGLAKAALDYSLERLPERSVAYTVYAAARQSPTHQLAVAQAASLIDAAHLLLARAATDIDLYATDGDYPDEHVRARIRMDTGQATTFSRQAIDLLLTANGAAAFAEDGVLGRVWRDINIGARHAFATPEIGKEILGRVLLGTDEPVSIGF